MANDLFGGTAPTVSGITADGVKMTFSQGGSKNGVGSVGKDSGLIIQTVDIKYAQSVQQLYALDVTTLFLISGRPQGNLQMTNVVGPGSLLGDITEKFGNVCAIEGAFNLSMATTCRDAVANAGREASVTLNSPLITEVGLAGNAQNFLITGSMVASFSGMQFS